MQLPLKALSDLELARFGIVIPKFIGVYMRDELHGRPKNNECGILNFNTHTQQGSHWVCWFKKGKERYYFDSYGEPPPIELLKYSKTPSEYGKLVIKRNAVTVQKDESSECGALCLFVLMNLSRGKSFPAILDFLLKRYKSCDKRLIV